MAVVIAAALGAVASGAGASAPQPARSGHVRVAPEAGLAPKAAGTSGVGASLGAAADAAGDQYLFWKGQDGNLWYTVYGADSSSWSTATTVPGMGPLGSQPTVVLERAVLTGPEEGASLRPALRAQSELPPYIWVMWEGVDGNLWSVEGTVTYNDASPPTISWPSTPSVVPGMGPLGSAPSAAYTSTLVDPNLWVFWKGVDGNLWSVEGTVSDGVVSWPSTPSVVPGMGPLGSAPTAGSDIVGNIYVFWQGSGSNTQVWEAWYNAQASTPAWAPAPIDLGSFSGNTDSAPSVAVAPAGEQYIFWQGADGNLYFAEWTGGDLVGSADGSEQTPSNAGWLGNTWNFVGEGPMGSAPAATIGGSSSTLDVFWKGTNLNIWMATSPTSSLSWTGPTSVGDGPLDG
jgi:hypothetical protein